MYKILCGRPPMGDFRDKISMRYHLFKTSPKKALLIADSQARYLTFGNINILSLPGATVNNVYQFVPPQGKYEIIVLFVGGNVLYSGYHPSVATPQEVFERIESLAKTLITVAKKLYVIGIPPPPPNLTRN